MTIAPQVVGSPAVGDSNNVVATSLIIPKPSTGVTVQDGDILVAVLRCGSSSQTTDYSLAGWTRRGLGFSASNAAVRVFGIFTHYVSSAASEPASYTFALAGNAFARQTGQIFVVRPGVGAQPWGAEPTYIAPTSFSGGPPAFPNSVSGITADSLAIHAHANEIVSPGTTSWTPPTGTTDLGAHGSLTTQSTTSATRSVVAAAAEVITGTTAGGSTKTGVWPSYSSAVAALLVIPGTAAAVTPPDLSGSINLSGSGSLSLSGSITTIPSLSGSLSLSGSGRLVAFGQSPATPLGVWLARKSPKWCAHRNGFSGVHGEFTLPGFTALKNWNQSVAWNIDVVRTSDGEFVASHDLTTGRVLSGTSLTISTSTWASISGKTTLVGGNPVTRLDDIVAIAPTGTVFFIDNKANTNHAALATKLSALGLSPGNVVYKIGATSTANFTSARANGYTTWAYGFDSDTSTMMGELSSIDWMGFDFVGTQANWNTLIGSGKPMFAHILSTLTDKGTADSKASIAGGSNFGYMVNDVAAVVPSGQASISEWNGTEEKFLSATWWNGTAERSVTTSLA